jgi:PKD repeat protein
VGSTTTIENATNIRFPEISYAAAANAYLVAWQRSNVVPYALFVAADGTLLGTPTALSSKAALSVGVACGIQGGSDICLVAWLEEKAVTDPPVVRGRLLRYNGGAISFITDPFVINQNGNGKQGEFEPAVAYSPTSNEFLVAWVDDSGGLTAGIRAQRVSGDGTLAGSAIDVAVTSAWEGQSVVTWNSAQNEFLVAYMYETTVINIAAQRIAAGTGSLVGSRNTVLSTTTDASPEIAYNSTTNQYLLMTYSSQWVINALLLDTYGVPLAATPTTVASSSGGPNMGLAYNSTANMYFAVFQHHDDVDEFGTGITAAGVATGAKFQITDPSSTRQAVEMSVASSTIAGRWLTVESDLLFIKGQLIDSGSGSTDTCTVSASTSVPTTATAGSTVSFSASGTPSSACGSVTASYAWNFGDSSTSTSQSPSHTYSSAGSYTWTLTVTAGTATTTKTGLITVSAPSSGTVSVTVYANPGSSPTAVWQSSGITISSGQAVSITADGTWYSTGGTSTTTAYTASGNGTVSDTGNVALSTAPKMALVGRIGASGAAFLVGASKDFISTTSGTLYFAPNYEWYLLWHNSGSLSPTVTYGAATCAVSVSTVVPTTGTVGTAVSFATTATPNAACSTTTATYAWSFGDGNTSTSEDPTHNYTAAGTYTWTLVVTADTATTTKTGSITVGAAASSGTATATVLANPGSSPTAVWQSSGIGITSGQVVSITASGTWYSTGGTSTTTAYTAAGSGTVSDTGNVPLSSAPKMALVGRIGTSGTPFLVGTSTEVTATASGTLYFAPNYEWYLLWHNSGTLTPSITYGTGTCSVSASTTVPATGTTGTAVSFAVTATPGSACGSVTPTYAWSFGDSSTSTSQNPSHTYSSAGTYAWSLTVTAGTATTTKTGSITISSSSSSGCTSATATVLANPGSLPTAIWQSSGISVTSGQVVSITASGTWYSTGGTSTTTAYTAAGSGTVSDTNNVPLSTAPRMALVGRIGTSGTPFLVGASTEVTATASGTLYFAPNYEWYLLWHNSSSLSVSVCYGTATCSVSAATTVPTTGTTDTAVTFAVTATPSTACGSVTPTYAWSFGDSSTSTSQNPSHTYSSAGTYAWSLTVTAGTATTTKTGSITISSSSSGCTSAATTVLANPGSSPTAIWQSSGIAITSGQVVSITASGTWYSTGGTSTTTAYTAAGSGTVSDGGNAPLSSAPKMALIGRIGSSGTPFVVGASKDFTAAESGTLYFAPNYEWYLLWHNSGSLSVSVCYGTATCSVTATTTVPTTGTAGTAVNFASTATPGSACGSVTASYSWDLGDGGSSTEQNPTHTYASAGTYTWTLTATAGSATTTKTGTITISNACTTSTASVLANPGASSPSVMWQSSGITVSSGQDVTFATPGSWYSNGGTSTMTAYTADGSGTLSDTGNAALATAPRMALVGRIGSSGTPFLVGATKSLRTTSSGVVYFAPNYPWYLLWHNSGSLTVSVCK